MNSYFGFLFFFKKTRFIISIIKLYFKRDTIRVILKKNPNYLTFIRLEYQLLQLYHDTCGYFLSKQERQQLTTDEDAFIYGEVEILPFFWLLQKAKIRSEETFYDLGSGIGKAAFVAGFYGNFSKILGLEILPGLHKTAENKLKKISSLQNDFKKYLTNIQFININFLAYDFSEADVIFVNATCFSYSTWEKLLEKFKLLKYGSRIIVTTKKIPLDSFKLIFRNFIPINKNMSCVSIYLKTD